MTEWAKQDDQQSVLDEVETSYEVYVENNYEDVPSDRETAEENVQGEKSRVEENERRYHTRAEG